MAKIIKEIMWGDSPLRIETGEIARQATGAVLVSWQETVVLVTVVAATQADESKDFFPLTVQYQERSYSAGRIPGGFLRREGRPGEHEVLNARLIDRPIRPLFPEGFRNEVQIVATVLSYNPQVNPDTLALIGASAVLTIARVPFAGPIGAVRVGYHEGVYQLNPTTEQLQQSQLDLVVAGTKDAILMVESEAQELSEKVMLGAVMFGHEMMQPVIQMINELADEVGNSSWEWEKPAQELALQEKVQSLAKEEIVRVFNLRDKKERSAAIKALRQRVVGEIMATDESVTEKHIIDLVGQLEKEYVRGQILNGEPRIDGRDNATVRPISIRTGLLPRTHGSAVFTRGETQAIVTLTLGSERDAQLLDIATGERKQHYLLHYNFPPYCVGETGMMGSPKRREIGHGNLARRATVPVLPAEDFPYVLRLVSEITESNGSSSMATVCGASLAMMDAGVPIKAPVAGIAMGLIKEGDKYAVLTDILGDEDHLGDMDFKVAGTANGVTALQMDIKITGITQEIMQTALDQAYQGRQHILGVMENAIPRAREGMSPHAPRYHYLKINPDKIRDVIGKGGVTIRGITDETGVTVDIDDDGTVKLFSPDEESVKQAILLIEEIVAEIEVDVIYDGVVKKIVDFGAFVDVGGGREGLLHISQISHERIKNVSDVLSEGQTVKVKCLAVEPNGRVKLSMKVLTEPAASD